MFYMVRPEWSPAFKIPDLRPYFTTCCPFFFIFSSRFYKKNTLFSDEIVQVFHRNRPIVQSPGNATSQPRSLRPTNFVNWPWLSPLTHRERRHTVASHMERRHTETHKNTTQETHIETLRNTTVVYHLLYQSQTKKNCKSQFFLLWSAEGWSSAIYSSIQY